jgi:hypothetical protein
MAHVAFSGREFGFPGVGFLHGRGVIFGSNSVDLFSDKT